MHVGHEEVEIIVSFFVAKLVGLEHDGLGMNCLQWTCGHIGWVALLFQIGEVKLVTCHDLVDLS